MDQQPDRRMIADIIDIVNAYMDGLYNSDAEALAKVFHPKAVYACASGGELVHLDMDAYFEIVRKRPSPVSSAALNDRVISVESAGPVTAFVRAECTIPPKAFTDLLSLIRVDGRWQIIAKVFHYDLVGPYTPGNSEPV